LAYFFAWLLPKGQIEFLLAGGLIPWMKARLTADGKRLTA
jgi:hypothetical protein